LFLLLFASHALYGATQLLIAAPGESFSGGSVKTGTPSIQTAGVPFNITVYACNADWSIDTSTAGMVTLTSSDNTAVIVPASQPFNSGTAVITVTLKKTGTGTQTLTASHSGGASAGNDTIPMTFGTLDNFNSIQNIPNETAGHAFMVKFAAVDAYNNTVTTFSANPTVSIYSGAAQLAPKYGFFSGFTITSGIISFNARVYPAVSNVSLELAYNSASGFTNTFIVSASTYAMLVFTAPGQVYDPGNNSAGGVSGFPNTVPAGVPVAITVYATDDYGNLINNIADSVTITTADSLATINGTTQTAVISLSGGTGSFTATFFTEGSILTQGNDQTGGTTGSINMNIGAGPISSFDIINVPSLITAGQPFNPVIRAKDQFGNVKTDYAGLIYISSTTDYLSPYESTMSVSGGNTVETNNKWGVTFTPADLGIKTITAYFYRAATFTAQVFASDNFSDAQGSQSGHFGNSAPCTVSAAPAAKMQILAPGMSPMAGTAEGYGNTPYAQFIYSDVTCTVNITDNWWNIITGRYDEIALTTNDPQNSKINDNFPLPQDIFLSNGTAAFFLQYELQTSSFFVEADNVSVGGIASGKSPDLTFNQLNSSSTPVVDMSQISITGPSGNPLTSQIAGVPFTIVITVYSSPGVVDTSVNGPVFLSANTDYNLSEYTIVPTVSVNLVSGTASMQVTMNRARSAAIDGSGAIIYAAYGSKNGTSNIFDVVPGPATSLLVLTDGMSILPGLRADDIPGYEGYSGTPKTLEAGIGAGLQLLFVDNNYNRVYNQPISYCKITSSDPQATLDGNLLSSNSIYVTVTAGVFVSQSGMVLGTVGATGAQRITANYSTYMQNTSPYIFVRHTDFNKLYVLAPSGPALAGSQIFLTITATDAYGNTCDNINGGTPFNNLVNLAANTGANTMWPFTGQLINGTTVTAVKLFKAPQIDTQITAEYSGIEGTSNNIITTPGQFSRLLLLGPGMQRQNGVFTTAQPHNFVMYDTTQKIFAPNEIASVNDAYNNPAGYQFELYSCDMYGNVTASAAVAGSPVTITTGDINAPAAAPVYINPLTGETQFNVAFHTVMNGVSVTASIASPSDGNFTTPSFTTLSGTPYGLQMLIPGLYAAGGTGYYDNTAMKWYNGVTGTALLQLSGTPFEVTIQAADIYGNLSNVVRDNVIVTSGAGAPSLPSSGSGAFNGWIGDVDSYTSTLNAQFIVSSDQSISIQAEDISNSSINGVTIYVGIVLTLPYTQTITPTVTQTLTSTISPTPTATPSGTFTPTATTITPDLTSSPTQTPDSTATQTQTITPVENLTNIPAPEGGTTYAYPQPASDRVNFAFGLDEAAQATVDVYNVLGVLVAKNEQYLQKSPANIISLNTTSFAPGIYYYIIKAQKSSGGEIKFKAKKFMIAK
jgi:hypothetical protein